MAKKPIYPPFGGGQAGLDAFIKKEREEQFDTNSKLMGQTHSGNATLHRGKKSKAKGYKKGGLVKGRKRVI